MKSHRLILTIGVFGVILGMLFFTQPSITGFVPTETYSQELDLDVYESQRFILRSGSDVTTVASFAIAGSVDGLGLANVYLSDGETRWLVFSNKKKPGSAMEHITGMAALDIEPAAKLDEIESVPSGYVTESGAFTYECIETCVLDENLFNKPELYLDVILEPGTSLHISGIRFASMSE
jgi:hypothetical protein